MRCPQCANGELKRRDAAKTARLECTNVDGCGFVEVYRDEAIRKLAKDEEEWSKIAKS